MKNNPPEKTAMWLFFTLGIFGLFVFAIQDLVRSDIHVDTSEGTHCTGDVELIELMEKWSRFISRNLMQN